MTPTLIHVVCLSGPDAGVQFVAGSLDEAIGVLEQMREVHRPAPIIPSSDAEYLSRWFGRS